MGLRLLGIDFDFASGPSLRANRTRLCSAIGWAPMRPGQRHNPLFRRFPQYLFSPNFIPFQSNLPSLSSNPRGGCDRSVDLSAFLRSSASRTLA